MKALLMALLLVSACNKEIKAQEGNNPETKPESDISSGTKKVLRKIGRKSMDETCQFTDDKATCEKQKLEHKRANLADEKDTQRRKRIKAQKKAENAAEKERELQAKRTQTNEDRTP